MKEHAERVHAAISRIIKKGLRPTGSLDQKYVNILTEILTPWVMEQGVTSASNERLLIEPAMRKKVDLRIADGLINNSVGTFSVEGWRHEVGHQCVAMFSGRKSILLTREAFDSDGFEYHAEGFQEGSYPASEIRLRLRRATSLNQDLARACRAAFTDVCSILFQDWFGIGTT